MYIQASLHADELPGMLVAHHLRGLLRALEAEGALRCEIVLVPAANPIGLAQSVLRTRWAASSPQRRELQPPLRRAVRAGPARVRGRLGADAAANTALIRTALREAAAEVEAASELASLRKTLLGLACDAEVVLDLHCDGESVLHLYTGTPLEDVEPLARCLGAHATLLAKESGDNPFDEACSQTWWQLAEHFGDRAAVAHGCVAVTVELRGEAEVDHALAASDAAADRLPAPPRPRRRHAAAAAAVGAAGHAAGGLQTVKTPVGGLRAAAPAGRAGRRRRCAGRSRSTR